MADQSPDVEELVGPIPKIVITEPSPFRVETAIGASTASSTAAAVESTKMSPEVGVQTSGDDSNRDSELKDPDCEQCEGDSKEKTPEVAMEVDVRVPVQPSEREREDNGDFRSVMLGNYFRHCMRALASFNQSKFMLIIQILLLALPISAGFTGAKYLDKCPLSSETPVFLFMMGITGTIVVVCRIMLISQKILLPTRRQWGVLRGLVIVGNLAVVVCLATEMFSFFRSSPSFEIGSAHYCHEVFYEYTYWANWTCVTVVAFLMFLQLPNCYGVTLQSDGTP